MKAQLVKNAVIVPTGAKGGFYPKQLPPGARARRAGWPKAPKATGSSSARCCRSPTISSRTRSSIQPSGDPDGEDPYFVVAADKGTATFSDVANAIALERTSGWATPSPRGGNGYDHKAMGITAKGAWIRSSAISCEMGVDVQTQPIRVAGCGDMSGDVFGNGMLLSKAIKLVAAFDHRHIFIDPDPDPAKSWTERKRMFELPRSTWDDYDRKAMSKGGRIVPRSQKSIELTRKRGALEIEAERSSRRPHLGDPQGAGRPALVRRHRHLHQGQPPEPCAGRRPGQRCASRRRRPKFAPRSSARAPTSPSTRPGGSSSPRGGRINTDFIDNSAGVDCSDNEVNIKIPLNREMPEGRPRSRSATCCSPR